MELIRSTPVFKLDRKIAVSLLSFREERRDEMVLLPSTTARTISLERDGDQGQEKKRKLFPRRKRDRLLRLQSDYHGSELNYAIVH